MTTTVEAGATLQPATSEATIIRQDALVAVAGLGLVGGLYLDGWAHIHVPGLETFFTPWHAVLYGSFLVLVAAIIAPALVGQLRGRRWWNAIPTGYGLALLGVTLFGGGGVIDLGWHTIFGVESDTEALLSPPHLLLAIGAGLMVTTPLRSAWPRSTAPSRWATWMPPLLSLAMLLALITFFTSYAHPFADTAAATSERPGNSWAADDRIEQAMGSVLLQAGILSGALLLLVRRWGWHWPPGSLALLLPLTLGPVALMFDRLLAVEPLSLFIAALVAGLVADGLLRLLRPSGERPAALRGFAALLPAVLYACYLGAIALSGGIWWTVHLISGAVTLAAIAGWLVSYLILPPASTA